MATFYNDKALVGGNGSMLASGKDGYKYMIIDRAGQMRYLTAG
jgi:hypothetical protein